MQLKLGPYLAVLIFTLFFHFTFAQKSDEVFRKEAAALNKAIQNTSSDIERINLTNNLARVYVSLSEYETAMDLANRSMSDAKKIAYGKGQTVAQVCIGEIYRSKGNSELANTSFNQALSLSKEFKEELTEALIYDQLGHLNWANKDTSTAILNHQKALKIRIKSGGAIDIGESYANLAEIYSTQGKIKEAFQYFDAALNYFKKTNRFEKIAWGAGNAGTMQYWLGNRREAISYYILAYENYEKIGNNEGFVWMTSSIANIYKSIYDYENAFKYTEKVRQNHLKTGDTIGIADAHLLKGSIYFKMQDFFNAKRNYEKGHEIYAIKKNDLGIMNAKSRLGSVYFKIQEFDKAIQNIETALKIAFANNEYRIIAECQLLMGETYVAMGKTALARKNLSQAFNFYKKSESLNNLPAVYKAISKLDSIEGNYQSAFENYKQYIHYSNLYKESDDDTEKIAMRYKFEKQQALDAAELKNKQTQRNAAIVGLILTSLLIIVLIYFFRLRNKKIKIEKEKIDLQKRDIQRIKETEHFKSRFLTNITHEFRTPLTLIKGHLEVLKDNGRTEDQVRFQEMDKNGSRLLQLISQLLDLSKMESGEYKLKFRNGNVINETLAFAQAFQSLADKREINFIVNKELAKDFNVKDFIYSQEALSSIISNLLSNSFKYTPKGGTVQIDLTSNSSDTLIIKVSDNGKGISKEALPNIFDRFFQVDEPSQRTYEGSGIGLSLVKELVLIHGGDITVTSSENQGCEFTVALKSAIGQQSIEMDEPDEQMLEQQIVIDSTEIDLEENDLPLILVVEDQEELRKFITQNLGAEYRFAEATNGKEGLQMAEELMPDLIISDVMMPDVDGLELCKNLKSNKITSHIPVILLTAKSDEEDKLRGLEIGANDYLTKPFSLAEVKLRVKNMLNLRKLIQKNFEGFNIPKPEVTEGMSSIDREFIEKIHQVIVDNLSSSQFGVAELADLMFLSISQFSRKLKNISGKTPSDYIKNFKLSHAVDFLKEGKTVAEAGWGIGFEDPVYFSKVFKKHFGYPPSDIKK